MEKETDQHRAKPNNNGSPTGEVVGSRAFNLEYKNQIGRSEFRDDMVSYLGEYRIELQKYTYEMEFSNWDGYGFCVRDSHRGEPMQIKARRAIEERKAKGLPIHRELAEEQGIQSLDNQLRVAPDGATVVWASPPGPKEEGYGDYGFVYIGQVSRAEEESTQVAMTAIRIENPTIAQYNKAMSALTGSKVEFSHEDDFLAKPIVLPQSQDSRLVDDVLKREFSYEEDSEKEHMFAWILDRIDPLISDLSKLVASGASNAEKIQSFFAIENYTLMLVKQYKAVGKESFVPSFLDKREQQQTLGGIVEEFGFTPPTVAGSCGSTSENSNTLSKSKSMLQILGIDESYSFDQPGPCRICKEDVPCGPCKICQSCDAEIRRKEEKSLTTESSLTAEQVLFSI